MRTAGAEQSAGPAKPQSPQGTKPPKAAPSSHGRGERPRPGQRGEEELGRLRQDFTLWTFIRDLETKSTFFKMLQELKLGYGGSWDSWPQIAQESWFCQYCWWSRGMKGEKAMNLPHSSRTMSKSKRLFEAAQLC